MKPAPVSLRLEPRESQDSLVDLEDLGEEGSFVPVPSSPWTKFRFDRDAPSLQYGPRARLYTICGVAALIILGLFHRWTTRPVDRLTEELEPSGRGSPAVSRFRYADGMKRYGALADSMPDSLDAVYRAADKAERNYRPAVCPSSTQHDFRYDSFYDSHKIKVLFTVAYSNNANVLMTAVRELPKIIERLGPENVHVSITEGGSTDSSVKLLRLLAQAVRLSGASFTISVEGDSTSPAAAKDTRLDVLCQARNDAIADLQTDVGESFGGFDAVIMSNDVVWCRNDVLELIMQHVTQGSDLMCGADYNELLGPTHFYDVWVARDILGQAFYHIRNWDWGNLEVVLPDNPPDRRSFDDGVPFQVFSCWNGLLISRPEPFLPPHNIKLRNFGSIVVSESYIINQDYWRAGFTKIAMHPRVKVAYQVPQYGDKTQAANSTGFDLLDDTKISWNPSPPPLVEYYDYHIFQAPTMRPWDWEPRQAPDRR